MKKFVSKYRLLIISGIFFLTGCATPQAMFFNVDVLKPKLYTFTPEDQTSSVITTYTNTIDSLSAIFLAQATARQLELNNALDEGAIGAFTIPAQEFSGTSDKEYLEQLMLATGSRCLFIVSNIEFRPEKVERTISVGNIESFCVCPIKANIDIYDAATDTVLYKKLHADTMYVRVPDRFTGSKQDVIKYIQANDSLIRSTFGTLIADEVSPNWTPEEWMLIDYPTDNAWHTAYKNAMDFKWEEAIKGWLPLTESENKDKSSYAAFNIAVACQMLGNTELALNWIQYARNNYNFREAESLEKYLKSRANTTNSN